MVGEEKEEVEVLVLADSEGKGNEVEGFWGDVSREAPVNCGEASSFPFPEVSGGVVEVDLGGGSLVELEAAPFELVFGGGGGLVALGVSSLAVNGVRGGGELDTGDVGLGGSVLALWTVVDEEVPGVVSWAGLVLLVDVLLEVVTGDSEPAGVEVDKGLEPRFERPPTNPAGVLVVLVLGSSSFPAEVTTEATTSGSPSTLTSTGGAGEP